MTARERRSPLGRLRGSLFPLVVVVLTVLAVWKVIDYRTQPPPPPSSDCAAR